MMVVTRILILSAVSYIAASTTKNGMELEREWIEKCMKNNKCPVPGLKSYKSPNKYDGIDCIDGFIELDGTSYPCNNMKLLSSLTLEDLGSTPATIFTPTGSFTGIIGSDVWGYEDKKNKKLYGLTCQMDGASIVDVTNPSNPIPIAFLPSQVPGVPIFWRDIKVYKNYMYIGADFGGGSASDPDGLGNHGLQYYNLDNIQNIDTSMDNLPITVSSQDIGLYTEFGECHNVIINEESGYLYAVGTDTCAGGLHVIDISDPGNPTFVTCFSDNGYIHDGQCVTYKNLKREICFTADLTLLAMSVIDVTDKTNIFVIATRKYGEPGDAKFTHQLWITPNRDYLLLNDELDEALCDCEDQRTRTYIFDIKDLENPVFIDTYFGTEEAISHNLYVDNKGKYAYLSNYQAGLRVLDITGLYKKDDAQIQDRIIEVAYFETNPDRPDGAQFGGGVWSSYIYFEDFVLIQTLDRGFFIVQPLLKGKDKDSKKKSESGLGLFNFDAIKSYENNNNFHLFVTSILFFIITLCLIVYNICQCCWKKKYMGFEDKVYQF